MNTLDLWLLLRRRDAGRRDPHRLTAILAVVAFAASTAISLLVLGGYLAFAARAASAEPGSDAGLYPALAGVAAGLLLIPLATLGGAAARLAVARRDERLAALRLAGATRAHVTGLALLDATSQAAIGAAVGSVGYFGLIPLVLPVTFQGEPFSYGELLVPWWVPPLAVLVVVAIAITSAGASLRRVAITPLGVAARTSPPALHWSRVLPVLAIVVGFSALWSSGAAPLIVLVLFLLGGLAAINLIGPWVLGLVGRIVAARARTAATLIAARRLVDSPKTGWRSVGGVALATFIAGMAAVTAIFGSADADPVALDIVTGGRLTLVIAALVAATSTGVMQAGRIIDQRNEYRALHLAGTDIRVMSRARLREVAIPLVAAVGLATAVVGMFLLPALGFAMLIAAPVVGQYLASVLGACALVLAGSWASKGVVRTVLA